MNMQKFLYLLCMFPSIIFSAQPPVPPKAPLLKAAAAVDRIILPSPWEPIPPMLAHFESKAKNGANVIYMGIIKINAQGGTLKCKVTHDTQNNTYSGQLFNERFSQAEWGSRGLEAGRAKEYYDNLREQDPDQKKRLG